jgi:hypothetical protein
MFVKFMSTLNIRLTRCETLRACSTDGVDYQKGRNKES